MTDGFQNHSVLLDNGAITEADVLITASLAERPARQPNLTAEIQALQTLANQLLDYPQAMLKTLVRLAKDLCRADTAGVSILETLADGTSVFRWVAIAGTLESLEQTTTPGNFSPCSTTIHCKQPQLYAHPERYFTYLYHPQFPIVEGLLFPLQMNNQPLGTIWIVSHNEQHQFDREDLRLMTSLAGFTASALLSMSLRQTAELALQREQDARQEIEVTRQAVNEADQHAVNILESITDAFISLDQEWRITYANQAVFRINNLQLEDIIGKTHWEVWPWSVGTLVEKTYRQVVADQVAAHFEVLYEPLKMWLEIHAYPAPTGLNLYFRDITERKDADAALHQSEERYRTLFESIDEGFAIIEVLFDENDTPTDYRFLEVNSAFESQTGLQQATGKTARQLVPNLEESWIETYGKVVLTGESLRFENGSETLNRWFNVYAFRIGQPEERKLAILFNDISDRKRIEAFREQSEKALHASEEKSRNILESITDGFFALDRDWRISYMNAQAERLLDRTPSALLGKVIWEEYPGTVGTEFERAYRNAATERVAASFISFYPDHNRWYEIHTYPAADGITVYFRDVTEHKQIESEREQLLQREQNARESAENANRIKDEFLAVLSHELRSPLNPIIGWSRLLQTGKLDKAKTAQALETIERNAKLQSELIEDLLDVSRILQGKLSLNVSSVSLAEMIRGAVETVRLAAEAKSIAVEVSLDPNVSAFSGDATRLQQVVWNLLSNAVKFTPIGGRVEVQLVQIENQAQITFRDNGKGILPEFLPYVFDYFRQADSTTTRTFGGLGLGLAIVRHLVELHGGTVEANSPGKGLGATFTVKLPLTLTQPVANQEELSSESLLSLQGFQVLIVDDDTDGREFIAFLLEQAGAIVISATSAGEALAAFTQSQPDILISDIGMPDMDGYMLMQQVRALSPEQGGQIPAIAMTAYAGDFNTQQALAAGFQLHIAKPIEPNQLLKAIAALLGGQS